ncbi:hypothetical protein L917_14054 [Phytophthora nicotianae]|uniref:Uncharacterized protein n=1 Tax=Phytophthora nicotianae TaxID=4792 RepID=W2KN61_PHYNI|nr:hypothetical protein L917_14054 [Phytophthora nicotianae]
MEERLAGVNWFRGAAESFNDPKPPGLQRDEHRASNREPDAAAGQFEALHDGPVPLFRRQFDRCVEQ